MRPRSSIREPPRNSWGSRTTVGTASKIIINRYPTVVPRPDNVPVALRSPIWDAVPSTSPSCSSEAHVLRGRTPYREQGFDTSELTHYGFIKYNPGFSEQRFSSSALTSKNVHRSVCASWRRPCAILMLGGGLVWCGGVSCTKRYGSGSRTFSTGLVRSTK